MSDHPYHPFSNGTQYADWQSANCFRCTKYNPETLEASEGCDLEITLSMGGETGDGSTTEITAFRCGYLSETGEKSRRYNWPCREVDWTVEWMEEFARREGYPNAAARIAAVVKDPQAQAADLAKLAAWNSGQALKVSE